MTNKIIKTSLCSFISAAIIFSIFLQGCSEDKSTGIYGRKGEISSGVNIHFTTGHEKDLDMIRDAGIRFIRMDFVWHDIEKERENYDWSAYDELTSNLKKRGLKALFILDYSNPLYEPEVESKDPLTGESQRGIAAPCHPESVEAFSKWAAAAASRYKDHDIVWEIWNEPNITFWRPAPDINRYIDLAMSVCRAVREVDPEAVIIGPATSQIPFPFIDTFLASGILRHIDGVSVHPYRDYARSPETAGEDFDKVRELISKYMPEDRQEVPVISSEWGYASATKGVSVETQAAYAVRMQLANLYHGVPLSVWYDWKNDGTQPGNFEHNCGTVTYDLVPKPAYIAIKTMNEQLKGFRFVNRIESEYSTDFILMFKNDQGQLKHVIWTSEMPHQVLIKGYVPEGSELKAVDWDGKELPMSHQSKSYALEIRGLPQYVTLPAGSNF